MSNYTLRSAGIPYKQALPKEKHKAMRTFLSMLLAYDKKARKLGIKPDVIRFISMYPVLISGGGGKGKKNPVTEQQKQDMIKMYEAGASYRDISRTTGRSDTTVAKYVKEAENAKES